MSITRREAIVAALFPPAFRPPIAASPEPSRDVSVSAGALDLGRLLRSAISHEVRDISLDGDYILREPVHLPPGFILTGNATVHIESAGLSLSSDCMIRGLRLLDPVGSGWRPVLKVAAHQSNVVIERCEISGGTSIWLQNCENVRVVDCQIESYSGYPIFSDGLRDSLIARNKVNTHGGYGIQLSGHVVNCKIANNQISADNGTKTGIILLNKGYGRMAHNLIVDNSVDSVSEEGISIDVNCAVLHYEVREDWRPGRAPLVCALRETADKRRNSAAVLGGQTIVYLSADQRVFFAAIEKVLSTDPLRMMLEDVTLPNLAAGTHLMVAWAPYGNIIRNNRIRLAGRNGIMLYGTQVANRVDANAVSSCGFGAPPLWRGKKPYRLSGISALTISQADHDSPLHGCEIIDNVIEKCPLGLAVGVARWDGRGLNRPTGMLIKGNSFKGCGEDQAIEVRM